MRRPGGGTKPVIMVEHLTPEQISLLLDDSAALAGGADHVAQCSECAREFERMSRMRMALSGLPDLEPPADEWERIEARLHGRVLKERPGIVLFPGGAAAWPLRAAAIVALFVTGLLFGQLIDSDPQPGTTGGAGSPLAGAAASPEAGPSPFDLRDITPAEAYLRTVSDLQALRYAETPLQTGPEAFAERITHLDAMIEASREALREAPEDPVLNNLLFQLVDERENLAGRLDQTLRMTAAEY